MATTQITSTKNPLIKGIRALADRDIQESDDRLVVEGVRMIEEVLASGVAVEVILYDPTAMTGPRAVAVLDRARQQGVPLVTATTRVVAACSQVETAQGIIAVVAHPRAALSDVLASPRLIVVIADRIQDHGYLGRSFASRTRLEPRPSYRPSGPWMRVTRRRSAPRWDRCFTFLLPPRPPHS